MCENYFQSRDKATLTSEASYALCMETLEESIKFILSHPLIERFDMETKLQVIEVRTRPKVKMRLKLENKYFSNHRRQGRRKVALNFRYSIHILDYYDKLNK